MEAQWTYSVLIVNNIPQELSQKVELQCFRSLKFREKNFFHNCNGKLGNFTKDALYLGHCSIPEWSEEIAFLT